MKSPSCSGVQQPPEWRIVIEDVSFGFVAIRILINNLNLTIHGQRIALVGGSGNRTLAKLIAGLHQPTDGTILFVDPPTPPGHQHQFAGMVRQDWIYGCSVRNLSLWNPSISTTDLQRACRDAEIQMSSRTAGRVGLRLKGGNSLSGGQRQQLELPALFARSAFW